VHAPALCGKINTSTMFKHTIKATCTAMLMSCVTAQAAALSILPVTQDVTIGDTIKVDIMISDLDRVSNSHILRHGKYGERSRLRGYATH